MKRWHPSTFIIFHVGSTYYFNLVDVSGEERVPWMDARSYFNDTEWSFVEEILKNV